VDFQTFQNRIPRHFSIRNCKARHEGKEAF
jgi:hypothetical protein